LACLALRRGQVVPADRLIEDLWGEQAPAGASVTLRANVSNLRSALGDAAVVVARKPGYVLDLPRDAVDADRFEDLCASGRRLMAAGDLARAASVLQDALGLWRGPVMTGASVPPSLAGRLAGLDGLRLSALEDRIEADLVLGRHSEVVGELEALVAEYPLVERLRELQMLALYRAGRQADALRAYQAARRVLAEELGIDPGRGLQELEGAILRQEPSLERVAAPVAAGAAAGGRAVAVAEAPPGPPFVGRGGERAELRAAAARAAEGRGSVALVLGEAGIGKTRLLDALADDCRASGTPAVVRSRCDEAQGAPAFWMWVQVVRALLAGRTNAQVEADTAGVASHLALLAPELHTRLPRVEPVPDVDPEAARFQLFDAVTTLLARRAAERPLAVLIDDLHWADVPSLLLLSFVARRTPDLPMLVVGTCRDDEVAADSSTGLVLQSLAGQPGVSRVALHGFSEADVAEYLRALSGAEPGADLAAAVWRRTDGNPFFVAEVARTLAVSGTVDVVVPEGVRAATRQRLARLPEWARAVVDVAAVAGREFQLPDVQRAADVTREELMRAVGAAVAAGVVAPVEGSIRAYRFQHDLYRETAYESIPVHERLAIHGRLAAAVERADRAGARVGEVAQHLFHAAPVGDPEKAIRFLLRAASEAMQSLAYEKAAAHAERARELLDLCDHGDVQADALAFDVFLQLGDARSRAGQGEAAREAFKDAAEAARRSGSAVAVALAGLGYGGVRVTTGLVDEVLVFVLEEALGKLGDDEPALRARVLARLAMELYYSADISRAAALADEAVALARGTADHRALAEAVAARHFCLRGPDDLAARLAVGSELLALAERSGDAELSLRAREGRIHDLLELGDMDAFELERSVYAETADALHQPAAQGQALAWTALRMLLEGRFDEVEPVMNRAFELGASGHPDFALQWFGVQLATLRREQGRHDEVFNAVWNMAGRFPGAPAWRCAVVLYACEMGRLDDTRSGLASIGSDFEDIPRDVNWFPAMVTLAVTVYRLGDAVRAARLYELLAAFEDRYVVVGGVSPSAVYGSVAYYLGLLAATSGRRDEAEAHFERALERNQQIGAAGWVAHTQAALASLLGTGARADELRAAARATASACGMAFLLSSL
jgi:DNA-binding SARP family transcriptional activator